MRYLLIAVEVIVGLLLIGVVLLQRSKDQGLGLAFGAGMGESLFGSQAVNVLIKITIVLSCIFFLNTMILARIMRSQGSEIALPTKAATGRAGSQARQGMPAATAPATGTEEPAAAQPFVSGLPAAGTEPVGTIPAPVGAVPVAP